MSTDTEIELTYLAKQIPPEVLKSVPQQLIDIYIPEEADYPSLRLRKVNDHYEITKKTLLNEGDFSTHHEHTIQLEQAEYNALAQTSNKKIEKKRFSLNFDDNMAEVDVFEGNLSGLVLIDFEFKSADEKAVFTPPSYCLADVTQEKSISGRHLAGKSYADIKEGLKRFNYKPLHLE